jgi:hypothetical protein
MVVLGACDVPWSGNVRFDTVHDLEVGGAIVMHTFSSSAGVRTCTDCPDAMRSPAGNVSVDTCLCGAGRRTQKIVWVRGSRRLSCVCT